MAQKERDAASIERLLDRLPVAAALFDGEDRLVYWNPALGELAPEGWDGPEVGLTHGELTCCLGLGNGTDGVAGEHSAEAGEPPHGVPIRWLRSETHPLPDGRVMRVWVEHAAYRGQLRFLERTAEILEHIARGFGVPDILERIAGLVDAHVPGVETAILLFEQDGRVSIGSLRGGTRLMRAAMATILAADAEQAPEDGVEPWQPTPGDVVARYGETARGFGLPLVDWRVLTQVPATKTSGILLVHMSDADAYQAARHAPVLDRAAQLATLALERGQRDRMAQLARDSAEVASRAKSDFMAKMSHELRTPLNAIIGFASMIESGFPGGTRERHKEYGSAIVQSGHHLLMIINDILDITRIEAGQVAMNDEPSSLAELWAGCREIVLTRAAEREIRIEDGDVEGIHVLCDPTKVRQCILNLVSNAIKFSPRGGTVRLSAAGLDSGQVNFTVGDDGCGMSAEELVQAMKPFGQVERAGRTENSGVGLGLPITKALMELHNGDLAIASRPGAGTAATLVFPEWRRLPLHTAAPGAAVLPA
jgi:signal transduction histidine kinase